MLRLAVPPAMVGEVNVMATPGARVGLPVRAAEGRGRAGSVGIAKRFCGANGAPNGRLVAGTASKRSGGAACAGAGRMATQHWPDIAGCAAAGWAVATTSSARATRRRGMAFPG